MHETDRAPRTLNVDLTIGGDKFVVSGEFTLGEVGSLFKEWAVQRGGEGEEIRKLSQEIVDETTKDAAQTADSTVPTT